METVLDRLKPNDIRRSPFPYLVIENALPEARYAQLAADFPDADRFAREHNLTDTKARFINGQTVINSADTSAVWCEFFEAHTQRGFAERVLDIFGEEIGALYGDFLDAWPEKTVGLRGTGDYDFTLDCQFVGIKPARLLGALPPHLDNPGILYSGLLYVRPEADTARGGDLVVYAVEPAYKLYGLRRTRRRYVFSRATVAYRANTFVLMLNSAVSFHAITPRIGATMQRQNVNIIGEQSTPLFDVSAHVDQRRVTRFGARLLRKAGARV